MRKPCPVYGSHSGDHAHQSAELNKLFFIGTYFEENETSRNKVKKYKIIKYKKLSIGED